MRLTVIILAGGFGTRLQPVIGENPKLLAEIDGVPFIEYLSKWIKKSLRDIEHEILIATGTYHEYIEKYVYEKKLNVKLIREKTPLGTLGGGILGIIGGIQAFLSPFSMCNQIFLTIFGLIMMVIDFPMEFSYLQELRFSVWRYDITKILKYRFIISRTY